MHQRIVHTEAVRTTPAGNDLTRSAKVTFTVIEGRQTIAHGQETARKLWNFTRWCVVGHNRRLHAARVGKVWDETWEKGYELPDGSISRYTRQSAKGLFPSYPGFAKMDKDLRDHWSAIELSDRCFTYTLKDFDIAMRSWFSNLKNNPKARPPRYTENPRQLTFEIGRNAKPVGEWTYRLTVLGGSVPDRYAVVKIHIQPGIKMRDIKLIRIRSDLTGTVVYHTESQMAGDCVAGIDLGIINIATVAFQNGESILYSGKAILSSDRLYQKKAKNCKPSGWRKGMQQEKKSKREAAYRRKAGDIRRLAIHNLTRNIVDECHKRGVGTIVLGDLKGIREDADHGKAGNQKLHAWPFAEVKRQITYKSEEVGIEVVSVSERNTSKCCHYCGQVGTRTPRGLLKCRHCGIVINSDVNGAFNILNKVSPSPAYAGVGVGAEFPSPPSTETNQGVGKVQLSQIHPTFIAKFDLRNWSIVQDRCNAEKAEKSTAEVSYDQ